MRKIDPEEYRKRLDKITELFADMVVHADTLSTMRCPYKNRFDQCTAQFGCRNNSDGLDNEDCILHMLDGQNQVTLASAAQEVQASS